MNIIAKILTIAIIYLELPTSNRNLMSYEDLKNFIHAVEHSYALRSKLSKFKANNQKIIEIAKLYGFKINTTDLEEDKKTDQTRKWFAKSSINPIKKL